MGAIRQLGAANDFTVEATEDPSRIQAAALERFQVVVFLSSTGEPLDRTHCPAQTFPGTAWPTRGSFFPGSAPLAGSSSCAPSLSCCVPHLSPT
ncbi:MAG TPA: hypothetical protein VFC13_12240 [Actinomycetes bacterium]|nr:hypothetical protein [Actinomycetes bacterium]